MPGVRLVDPMIENQVMVTAGGVARGAVVRGLTPEDMRHRKIVADHIVAGSLDHFQGDDAVLLGRGSPSGWVYPSVTRSR